jgi:hypothetical protein
MSLKEQLAEYRADWFKRVPAGRQAVIERHVNELRNGLAKAALKPGDRAPAIVLTNAKDETVDVGTLLKRGPVIVTFYRGGWCPYCNLELKAFQKILPDISAAGATLVAISPEKPDDTLSTALNIAGQAPVLTSSDIGHSATHDRNSGERAMEPHRDARRSNRRLALPALTSWTSNARRQTPLGGVPG